MSDDLKRVKGRNDIDVGMVLLDRVWRYLNSQWVPINRPEYSYCLDAWRAVNELGFSIYPDWSKCGNYNYSIEDWWNGKEMEL